MDLSLKDTVGSTDCSRRSMKFYSNEARIVERLTNPKSYVKGSKAL